MALFVFPSCQNNGSGFSNALIDLEHVDLTKEWPMIETVAARDSSIETEYFRFHFIESALSAGQMSKIVQQCHQNISTLEKTIGGDKLTGPVEYLIYPSIEKKGLSLQNATLAHVDQENQKIYAVAGGFFEGYRLHPENEWMVRLHLGTTVHSALEKGLAIYLNPDWQKKGYDYWVGRLFTSGNLPPLGELLDEEWFANESDLIMGCAAASLVDFLISKHGMPSFLAQYASFSVAAERINEMQEEWVAFLSSKYTMIPAAERKMNVPWLKGFNFAHEGYRIYNGYGSSQAENSMQQMINLGCNALAIVPYSYMRSDDVPSYLPIMRNAGSETDESVVATHLQAKKMKAFTMLKPQIWMRGGWPGSIKMKNAQDWDQFFDYYYRWMRHYALMAEIWEMDMLCVGVEFAEATKARPEGWRKLIRKLRGIYSGPMTYAANWGEEFESIPFWDELDFIGLNCYYPLSKNKSASRAELEEGFRRTVQKIEKVCNRFQKPVIFTEIGFRSVEGTWVQPHEEANGRPMNEAQQSLCYEIVLNEIMDKKWCRGIIWWKWPSYADYDHRGGTGFTPSGKLAQEVVKEKFSPEAE